MHANEFDLALSDVSQPDRANLRGGLAAPASLPRKLVESDLFGEGGFACRLSDLVGFDALLAVAHQCAAHGDPVAAVAEMLKVLMRLRAIRVPLSGDEVRVLRAVKRGHTSEGAVGEFLGLDQAAVRSVIDSLKEKSTLNGGVTLIAESDGLLSTPV